MMLTRRSFVATAVATVSAGVGPAARQRGRPDVAFTQYHNQTSASSLHRRLVEMWSAIRNETGGRVDAQVFAENNRIAGSDPAALDMLVAGEIHFFTLMGGILGTVVPVAEVQQVPFAFTSANRAHRAMDGPLGAYLRTEMAAKGIHGFAVGAFDNGMRQIAGTLRPIVVPGDLNGIRMRVPAGAMVADTFRAFGADPITINSSGIHEALRTGKVDAQENPLINTVDYGVHKYHRCHTLPATATFRAGKRTAKERQAAFPERRLASRWIPRRSRRDPRCPSDRSAGKRRSSVCAVPRSRTHYALLMKRAGCRKVTIAAL